MSYTIKASLQRRAFKKRFGQSNHFLITALVGLDYLLNNNVSCPAEFSTVWSPYDKANSVFRSRQYLLESFLVRSVDALDSYFMLINRSPKLVPANLQSSFDSAERSVNKKLEVFFDRFANEAGGFSEYASLVALSIQWRNNVTHFNANNILEDKYLSILNSSQRFYESECSGLSILDTITHFSNNDSPTFKETASIIAATHRFVQLLDALLLKELGLVEYAYSLISKPGSLVKVKGISKERAIDKIVVALTRFGFKDDSSGEGLGDNELEELYDRLLSVE